MRRVIATLFSLLAFMAALFCAVSFVAGCPASGQLRVQAQQTSVAPAEEAARPSTPLLAAEETAEPPAPDAVPEEPEPMTELRVPDGWIVGRMDDDYIGLTDGEDSASIRLRSDGTVDWGVVYRRGDGERELTCVASRSERPAGGMPAEPAVRRESSYPLVISVNWPISDLARRDFLRTLEQRDGGICF